MIEIEDIEPINKGALLAKCNVHIKPWKLRLHEVKIFERGAERFLGMPSQTYEGADGSIKYKELVTFDNSFSRKRFFEQVLAAIDAYIETNPDLEPEPLIKEDEEAPF